MRSLFRLLCPLALVVVAPAWLPAADIIPDFSQRVWQRADGLPSNEITDLCQDHQGYLWVATSAGLVRFDGSRFLGFGTTPGGHLVAQGLAAIEADPADDVLWAAPFSGGLIRYRGGRFEEQTLPGRPAGQRIARLHVAADRALWVALEGGEVMRLHGEQAEVFGAADGLTLKRSAFLAGDGQGRVWVASDTHLFRYEAGRLHPLQLPDMNDDLRLASARQDGPWVLGRGWLHKVVGDALPVKIKVNANFNARSVQALIEDSAGAVWTGSRARGVRRLTLPDEESDLVIGDPEEITALLEDRSGNVWVGSNGGGLLRVRSAVLKRFDKAAGLLESHTLGVCEDATGTIWIANRDGGVAYVNAEGRSRALDPLRVRETFSVRSVTPAGAEGVWVATSHGLLRATKQGLVAADDPAAPPPTPNYGQMRVSLTSRVGDLWVALEPSRLGRLRGGAWRVFTEADGLGAGVMQAVVEDGEGVIWVGTEYGRLYRLAGERFTEIPRAVPENAGGIQAIHFDALGRGWLGTAGAGLLRLHDAESRPLGERHGLPSGSITQIISDEEGDLWLGSPQGIFQVRREELDRFFAGGITRVHAMMLGEDEGLTEISGTNGYQPSVWKSRDGLLWFATREGVVVIDPRREKAAADPLPVRIDTVRADGALVASGDHVRLPSRVHTVEVDYSVLCLTTPSRVRAQVRLRGYDDSWQPADLRSPVRYTRLPPGEYRFEVRAELAGTPGTLSRISLPITVAAAWWQTLWFRVGAGLLVLLGGILSARAWTHRRLRMQRAELERATALERERDRIARNIHDDLGSGLTRISLLTQAADPGDGRAQLDKIYHTVSDLTQSMDEIVWAVNPKNDNLEGFANYLVEYAQGFLSDAGLRCRVEVPAILPAGALPAQFRHHLFLSCKEALNNVAKHAQATEVAVQLRVEAARLVLVVADNGRGFGPVQRVAPQRTSSDGGQNERIGEQCAPPRTRNGLANLRSRLAELGGTCEVVSSGSGTTVTFSTPLPNQPPPS